MQPNVALSFAEDRLSLLCRLQGQWHQIGSLAVDQPDLDTALSEMRATAQAVAANGQPLRALLLVPHDLVRFTRIEVPVRSRRAQERYVLAALDGLTPYAVEDLVFDWIDAPDAAAEAVDLAAVARETLAEAAAFARAHGFEPVACGALDAPGRFEATAWFGAPPDSDKAAAVSRSSLRAERAVIRPQPMPALRDAAVDATPEDVAPVDAAHVVEGPVAEHLHDADPTGAGPALASAQSEPAELPLFAAGISVATVPSESVETSGTPLPQGGLASDASYVPAPDTSSDATQDVPDVTASVDDGAPDASRARGPDQPAAPPRAVPEPEQHVDDLNAVSDPGGDGTPDAISSQADLPDAGAMPSGPDMVPGEDVSDGPPGRTAGSVARPAAPIGAPTSTLGDPRAAPSAPEIQHAPEPDADGGRALAAGVPAGEAEAPMAAPGDGTARPEAMGAGATALGLAGAPRPVRGPGAGLGGAHAAAPLPTLRAALPSDAPREGAGDVSDTGLRAAAPQPRLKSLPGLASEAASGVALARKAAGALAALEHLKEASLKGATALGRRFGPAVAALRGGLSTAFGQVRLRNRAAVRGLGDGRPQRARLPLVAGLGALALIAVALAGVAIVAMRTPEPTPPAPVPAPAARVAQAPAASGAAPPKSAAIPGAPAPQDTLAPEDAPPPQEASATPDAPVTPPPAAALSAPERAATSARPLIAPPRPSPFAAPAPSGGVAATAPVATDGADATTGPPGAVAETQTTAPVALTPPPTAVTEAAGLGRLSPAATLPATPKPLPGPATGGAVGEDAFGAGAADPAVAPAAAVLPVPALPALPDEVAPALPASPPAPDLVVVFTDAGVDVASGARLLEGTRVIAGAPPVVPPARPLPPEPEVAEPDVAEPTAPEPEGPEAPQALQPTAPAASDPVVPLQAAPVPGDGASASPAEGPVAASASTAADSGAEAIAPEPDAGAPADPIPRTVGGTTPDAAAETPTTSSARLAPDGVPSAQAGAPDAAPVEASLPQGAANPDGAGGERVPAQDGPIATADTPNPAPQVVPDGAAPLVAPAEMPGAGPAPVADAPSGQAITQSPTGADGAGVAVAEATDPAISAQPSVTGGVGGGQTDPEADAPQTQRLAAVSGPAPGTLAERALEDPQRLRGTLPTNAGGATSDAERPADPAPQADVSPLSSVGVAEGAQAEPERPPASEPGVAPVPPEPVPPEPVPAEPALRLALAGEPLAEAQARVDGDPRATESGPAGSGFAAPPETLGAEPLAPETVLAAAGLDGAATLPRPPPGPVARDLAARAAEAPPAPAVPPAPPAPRATSAAPSVQATGQTPAVPAAPRRPAALTLPTAAERAAAFRAAAANAPRPPTRPARLTRPVRQATATAGRPVQVAESEAEADGASVIISELPSVSPSEPATKTVAREATVARGMDLDLMNLIGVFGTQRNRTALIRLPNGRIQRVKVGDTLQGGKVTAIGDTEVRYTRDGQSLSLKLPRG